LFFVFHFPIQLLLIITVIILCIVCWLEDSRGGREGGGALQETFPSIAFFNQKKNSRCFHRWKGMGAGKVIFFRFFAIPATACS
jgi:hypothetical protein